MYVHHLSIGLVSTLVTLLGFLGSWDVVESSGGR